jgi:hypothetical protein
MVWLAERSVTPGVTPDVSSAGLLFLKLMVYVIVSPGLFRYGAAVFVIDSGGSGMLTIATFDEYGP